MPALCYLMPELHHFKNYSSQVMFLQHADVLVPESDAMKFQSYIEPGLQRHNTFEPFIFNGREFL